MTSDIVRSRQSLAGLMREHIAWIDERIAFGMPLQALVDHLVAMGYRTNRRSLASMLARARKWHRKRSGRCATGTGRWRMGIVPDADDVKGTQGGRGPTIFRPADALSRTAGFEFEGTKGFTVEDLF